MLIRSQNKNKLVNLDNITWTSVYENCIVISNAPVERDDLLNIGEYSTNEKSLKVLDMIQENIKKVEIAKIGGLNCHEIEWIFQMPQDDEVQ